MPVLHVSVYVGAMADRSGGAYRSRGRRAGDDDWDAQQVRELRRHLQLTQRAFADELNARQQTVSEWETGRYRPRGPSARLLTWIAEGSGFPYEARPPRREVGAAVQTGSKCKGEPPGDRRRPLPPNG